MIVGIQTFVSVVNVTTCSLCAIVVVVVVVMSINSVMRCLNDDLLDEHNLTR